MAESEWLTRRAQRLQDLFIDVNTGLTTDEHKFNLYMRYKNAHKREFHKCLSDLLKLRGDKRKADLGFEAQRVKNEKLEMQKSMHDVRIFVLQNETYLKAIKVTDEFMRASRENPVFESQFEKLIAKMRAA